MRPLLADNNGYQNYKEKLHFYHYIGVDSLGQTIFLLLLNNGWFDFESNHVEKRGEV